MDYSFIFHSAIIKNDSLEVAGFVTTDGVVYIMSKTVSGGTFRADITLSLTDQTLTVHLYDSATGDIKDKAVASKIEVALKGEGDNVSLESAKLLNITVAADGKRTQEQADANKAILADAKIFENAIITTTDCIATYKLTKVDDVTYEISGIVMNSKGTLKIDTSAAFN